MSQCKLDIHIFCTSQRSQVLSSVDCAIQQQSPLQAENLYCFVHAQGTSIHRDWATKLHVPLLYIDV